MFRWTEGHVHLAMRKVLRKTGWTLIAGEYPGGSDHELYPLNVVDPTVARDQSPDPRRHSLGELIPDLIALRDRQLLIAEAKVSYNVPDMEKLLYLVSERRDDFFTALEKFAEERNFPILMPLNTLQLYPTLVFVESKKTYKVHAPMSHLLISSPTEGKLVGELEGKSVK